MSLESSAAEEVPEIKSYRQGLPNGAKFSILIPTWNNLPYLKCCIETIRRHSSFQHQIIVHINDGSDGSLEWIQGQGLDYTYSTKNAGVCHALNAAAKLAQTKYICFFNDDMAALPGWDDALWKEIQALDHDRWFVSSTMIEPTDTGNLCVIAPQNFGQNCLDYREADLLEASKSWTKPDWSGATWPPNIVPKTLWDEVGGYSVEFTPGMSSDPDFSMKLWKAGVRYFKGIGASRVYHFQTKSTGKVKKNDGPRQFLEKWGITQGTFGKYYLRRGQAWKGPLPEPGPRFPLLLGRIKGFLKR